MNQKSVGLFIAGERGYRVLKKLFESNVFIEAVLVLVQFKHEINNQTGVIIQFCEKHKIPYTTTRDVKPSGYPEFLDRHKFDVVFVVSWRYLIAETCFPLVKRGIFVLHDSLLPKDRGFAPTNWAIINGNKMTGLTLFRIAKDTDAGDIVDQRSVKIEKRETATTLNHKLTKIYPEIILDNIDAILDGTVKETPQKHSEATYLKKRKPEDGRICFDQDVKTIDRFIRALSYPYPGAFCEYNGKKIIIWEAAIKDIRKTKQPGAIEDVSNESVNVFCYPGVLMITKVAYYDQPDHFFHPKEVFIDRNVLLT